jgi:hypothetical protein
MRPQFAIDVSADIGQRRGGGFGPARARHGSSTWATAAT